MILFSFFFILHTLFSIFSPIKNELESDQAHLNDEERKAATLRVIRRAKRMALPGRDRAYSTCETGQFPQAIGGKQPPVPHKNSRKSRSGFGRGLPKKGKFQNLDQHHSVLEQI